MHFKAAPTTVELWKMLFVVAIVFGTLLKNAHAKNLIVEGPTNTTVKDISQNITLPCRTSQNATVQWFYNDNPVKNSTYYGIYRIDENNSLIVRIVSRYFATGKYECAVVNGNVTVEKSDPAWLLVWFLEVTNHNLYPENLYIGETIISASVSWQAYPTPNLTLYLNGENLDNKDISEYFVMTNTTTKTRDYFRGGISASTTSANSSKFSGNYSVRLQNEYGMKELLLGTVNIFDSCHDSWKCPLLQKCVKNDDVCDGRDDCGDSTDETRANCSLPSAPTVVIYSKGYDYIKIRWSYSQMSYYHIVTFITLEHEGIVLRELNSTSRYQSIYNLQNGTSYSLKLKGESLTGTSLEIKTVNFTLQRMVAPGPPENMSVTVGSTFSSISLRVYFARPKDDGGSRYLSGNITKCEVIGTTNRLINCTTKRTYLSSLDTSSTWYSNLKGQTKYSFSLYFYSTVKQVGPSRRIFYTTPKERSYTTYDFDSGLSTGAIAGIVIACVSAFLSCVGAVIKVLGRSHVSTGQSVAYYPSTK